MSSCEIYLCFVQAAYVEFSCFSICLMNLTAPILLFHLFQNLTEFNTAHNKRISTLTIEDGNLDIVRPKRKRRSSRVSFSEEEEIINPGVLVRVDDDPRAHTHTLAHRHARSHTHALLQMCACVQNVILCVFLFLQRTSTHQ